MGGGVGVVPRKRGKASQGSGYLLTGREIFQYFNDQQGPTGEGQAESTPHSVRLLLAGGMRWELPRSHKGSGVFKVLRFPENKT